MSESKEGEKTQPAADTKSEAGEDALLVEGKHRVSLEEAQRLRWYALLLAWFTVVSLTGLSIAALVLSVKFASSSALAVALETLLDTATSCVVIWRYAGSDSAASLYSRAKERMACILLGVLCLVIYLVLLVRSSMSLARGFHMHSHMELLYITIATGIICVFLTVGKSYVAWQLESISIGTDAVNSGLGVLLSASTIITFHWAETLWFIDAVVGICAAILLCLYGVWVIVFEVKSQV